MKTKNKQDEFTAAQKAFGRSVLADPCLFAKHILGVELWDHEIQILQSIKNHRSTAVKACHGIGKTFTLAVALLWWLARYAEGIVLTTSPTQRQVRTQLWFETHRLAKNARVPYPKLKTTELKFRGEDNYAIGFSTNHSVNFQGYHGKYVLIIADEAPGIEAEVFDAIAGTMAGGKVHIVMAGNPTIPSGAFYDAFTKERKLWNCFTLGAFDSPNLKGLDLDQLLRLDPAEGGPLDCNEVPYLVTKRWVYNQHPRWWHGSASTSPNWQSRVMAQFPDQAQNALIKQSWLERANQRALRNSGEAPGAVSLVAGVDVGGEVAETVVYICECKPDASRIVDMRAWRGEDTRGQVVEFLNQYRRLLAVVRVDSIGIGHNFAKHLQDCRFNVEPINVGMHCESNAQLGENDPSRRFVNLKACFYQRLADLLERDQLEGLADEITIAQLSGIWFELDSQGRTKIESKDDARKRGVLSFDRADALMLALCKPPFKFVYYSINDLRQSDDDEPRKPGGRWESWAPGRLSSHFRRNRGAW